jgi:putative aldouronate transport system permease protein
MARIWQDKFTYTLLLPAFVFTLLFAYWPIYGTILAFKDFKFKAGILGSPWARDYGFYWFLKMFKDPGFIIDLAINQC